MHLLVDCSICLTTLRTGSIADMLSGNDLRLSTTPPRNRHSNCRDRRLTIDQASKRSHKSLLIKSSSSWLSTRKWQLGEENESFEIMPSQSYIYLAQNSITTCRPASKISLHLHFHDVVNSCNTTSK